jgi:hypothetical protein
MDQTGLVFKYLAEKFPRLSEAKIKEGVFVGPEKICSTTYFRTTRKTLGTCFVWRQITSSGISG